VPRSQGRIRVGVVVTRFIAGAGGVAMRGALALDPDCFEVTILAGREGDLLDQAADAGFGVRRLVHMRPDIAPRHDLAAMREVSAHIEADGYDVIHTHSAKAGLIGRVAARWQRVPAIIHTFHGFPFHDYQSRVRRATYVAIERALARITDQFLAIGSGVAADAVRLGIAPAERIRAIGSAIEHVPPVTLAARHDARTKIGIPINARVAGTVGRLDFQKAPRDMLAAFAHLGPDVHFVWVGGGPLYSEISRKVSAAGLAGRFHLLGERRDVADLLPAFDVFAMASLYEGIPCSVVEAMECGIPVVATAVNSVSEVVVPGRTGLLVPPARPAQLGRAIQHLLEHPDLGQRLSAAARENLGERFNVEVLGRDLTDTYLLALSGRARLASVTPMVRTA
jgi:glycosyltransferase involved in cell wall biosynthesis